MLLVPLAFVVASTATADVVTTFDPMTRTVEVAITDLPPYIQISLEGVTGLFWCSCLHPDNPATLSGTGFTVNGSNLDMQYEGPAPPPTNYIMYALSEEFDFAGFELVEWIQVTKESEGEFRLMAERPIIVPEPTFTTGLFASIGLALAGRTRHRPTDGEHPRSLH